MLNADPFALIVLFIGLSLLPFLAMIATSYLKIVVVMSLIRNALGIQSIPPNMVINAMALILTFYIMAPLMNQSWDILQQGLKDNKPEVIYQTDIAARAAEPFRGFLKRNTAESHIVFFASTAERLWAKTEVDAQGNPIKVPAVVDPDSFYILVPSFCVSELTRAFQIGFLVYLPFIAIDIIISNILLAMGMMMVSPVTISLPFKLLLFVMVNGWARLIQGLVQSYV
ncbi:MAG: type III secretion system export apparatus subunit SctR [Victivallales bacterium]|nr:type III secretion system export apparatus subunit SctR [Victivallales bacterium]